jgi:hypothetical protein
MPSECERSVAEARRIEAGSTTRDERPVLADQHLVHDHVVAAGSLQAVDIRVLDDADPLARDHRHARQAGGGAVVLHRDTHADQ